MPTFLVDERTTQVYTTTVESELSNPLQLSQLTTLTLTLYDATTGTIINGSKDRRTVDELNRYCRECCAEKRKNIPTIKQREYQRRWRERHPAKAQAKWQRENEKYGKEKSARWRKRNPERARVTNLAAKLRMRERVAQYKSSRGCERCSIQDPRVLDLHHRNGEEKILAVSQMLSRFGIDTVLAEMDKCRVLCANCHRIEHYEDSQGKIS